jgi:hypothetical protein
MATINLKLEQYDGEFMALALDRMEHAAVILRDAARSNAHEGVISRGPYKTGKYAGKEWTAREIGGLKRTIRVTRSKDPSARNVWVMSGNYKAWYAVQEEFGRGGWKGGGHPYMRPAISSTKDAMRREIEGG